MMKLNRLEFWIATAASVLVLSINLPSVYSGSDDFFLRSVLPPILTVLGIYFAFLVINNEIVFRNLPDSNWNKMGWQSTAVMIMLLAVLTTADQIYRPGKSFEHSIFEQLFVTFWIGVTFAFYIIIKYYLIQLKISQQTRQRKFVIEMLYVAGVWLVVLLLLIANDNSHFGPIWITAIPFGILIYFLNRYWLLPDYHADSSQTVLFGLRLAATVVVLWIIFFLIREAVTHGVSTTSYVMLTIFAFFCSMCIAVYAHQQSLQSQQVHSLKTELGRSSADLQLLRSQINPHFLFNILNTLYGTAIQESADRTSEGIQRLGDMMRFMLHENTLEFIPVVREIDYLKDYIHLQSLRIAHSPQIAIQVNITNDPCHHVIAPMLLIPFVENAFKHGISLQNPSWITMTMHCEDNRIDFDVHNSIHVRQENDTEKFHGGIGLENVKQRLQLLYAQKHELIIRESKTEYFVHLTVFV
ncbi:histidine kinase [Dyadobacter luteus]|uniref:Histidine kinase n=1 Tax=Dyadobacter luteus TaxID=2259619 RepID=A0A3D8YAL7_9BACT|nr:histidine kinase [Dyadobacter luteus]REA60856.1 histidine kinase [Dyadobacter luteus]